MPDHGDVQLLLLARHDLFQEVDRQIVRMRQVHADVAGQEVVDFLLAVVLRLERLGRHLYGASPSVLDRLISLVEVSQGRGVCVVLHCGLVSIIIVWLS